MNLVLMHEKKQILRNAQFVLCSVFAFYYAFRSIYEIFYLIPGVLSKEMNIYLFDVIVVADVTANLLYAYAAILIPRKQKFSLSF